MTSLVQTVVVEDTAFYLFLTGLLAANAKNEMYVLYALLPPFLLIYGLQEPQGNCPHCCRSPVAVSETLVDVKTGELNGTLSCE